MKPSASINLCLALLLCFSPVCLGQTSTGAAQQAPATCDQIRSKTAQFEQMNLNAMSPSVQQLYKESLLKLYTQFSQCTRQDISHTTSMRDAAAGTDAAAAIDNKLQTLVREEADVAAKLTILRTALNVSDTPRDTERATSPTAESFADDVVVNGAQASVAAGGGDTVSGTPPATAPDTATPPAAAAAVQNNFPCLPGSAYDGAPMLLTDIVTKASKDVAAGRNNGALSGIPQMMLYTTLDASSPTSSQLLRGLEAYQYLSETARTDKQLGASATSNGAVSAIEKPGFARLLGFAVEHGAIDKKNDGTNLTLSTSLYSLYAINREDTAETYARAGVLNRVGVFASFAVDNQENDLANARRNNLSEWSVKARLFGDRSTRSPQFQKFWDEQIAPVIDQRLIALGQPLEDLTSQNVEYQRLRRQVGNCLRDAVRDRVDDADYVAATPDARATILSNALLGMLKSNVYDRISTAQFKLDDAIITRIETQYVPGLKAALDNLKAAGGVLEKRLADLKKGPLGTFAYTNHRQPMTSDYSETKFLFEQDKSFLRPLKLTANFGLSFYHKPDRTMNQQKLRDISAALSFDGSSRSPFTEGENQSKITYSFVGRYERMMENRRMANRKPDIAVAQFVMEIPFLKGFSLPLSLSYANATEEERKKNVRFNFGMRLDTDKLFDLLRASTPR
jgi:DNA-binding transcriptional regulator YdaS (Cro superfamily)